MPDAAPHGIYLSDSRPTPELIAASPPGMDPRALGGESVWMPLDRHGPPGPLLSLRPGGMVLSE
jgi:hypothetical protein